MPELLAKSCCRMGTGAAHPGSMGRGCAGSQSLAVHRHRAGQGKLIASLFFHVFLVHWIAGT